MIVFVTGGTGLIGSNVCGQLIERGDEVRALARPGSEVGPLRNMGVTIVEGDITDPVSVRKAADGCETAVHAAAILGGVVQEQSEHQSVNIGGVGNVLDAAEALGMRRVVTYGTTTYFDFKTKPLTEHSPVDDNPTTDPYTVTKRAAYLETMRRTREGLVDACVVIPGGTFGPAPTPNRALEAPSFNLRLLLGLQGKMVQAVSFPIPWVLASDVAAAAVAAIDKGVSGETYLAFGPPDAVTTMAVFVNRGLEMAGVDHRVRDITAADLDADPELKRKLGPSMDALARQQFPQPFFVNDLTVERLGYDPVALDPALEQTIAWLRIHHPWD
jgi:nucleoside-diphosphate-sugar epimerase